MRRGGGGGGGGGVIGWGEAGFGGEGGEVEVMGFRDLVGARLLGKLGTEYANVPP